MYRWMNIFNVAWILLLSVSVAHSEIDLDFNGYVYNMFAYQDMPESAGYFGYDTQEKYFLMDLTRLRLRPTLNFGENDRITMHYELDLLASKVALPYFGYSGKTNRQAVNLGRLFINDSNLSARHYIDMLYYKHIFDFGEITLGRQVISWGTGRVWQPTDMFNPINPANFSKFEKDGADAIAMKFYLGNFTDLELVYNFREKLKNGNFAGRFRTNFNEYDVSWMAGYFDKKIVIGADFAGNLYGAGFRGEGIFAASKDNLDSNYVRFILGLDYQFSPELYALIEYQFNGEGRGCKCSYDLERLKKGEIQNVGLNYITIQSNYQFHPLVSGLLTSMTNIIDGSGFLGILGAYNALENLNIRLGGMVFYGSELSEYWYYSTAIYLLGEFYF